MSRTSLLRCCHFWRELPRRWSCYGIKNENLTKTDRSNIYDLSPLPSLLLQLHTYNLIYRVNLKTTQKSYEMTIFVVRLGVFCIEWKLEWWKDNKCQKSGIFWMLIFHVFVVGGGWVNNNIYLASVWKENKLSFFENIWLNIDLAR